MTSGSIINGITILIHYILFGNLPITILKLYISQTMSNNFFYIYSDFYN